jgi:hypothetical protein
MSKLNFVGSRGWMKYASGEVGMESFYIGTPLIFSKGGAKMLVDNGLSDLYRLVTRKYHEE